MSRRLFGKTDESKEVHRVTINGGGLSANILTWGAVLQDLRLEGHHAPLVLGFKKFDHYPQYSPYFGSIAGRFANRIANGRFEIDGKHYQTDQNFLNKHTLHGGSFGLPRRIWEFDGSTKNSVTLVLFDPEGTMGFPGNVHHKCTYSLHEGGVFRVELSSNTDHPTPVNLAHHSYFTLDDTGDCREHTLQIAAPNYTPVNEELIPTGEIAAVADTPFDFLKPKKIGRDMSKNFAYDHNFCLSNRRREMTPIANVHSERSNISLDISTTEPGLQFYAGHKVSTPVPGLAGKPYGAYAGMALETQLWPDAPNQPHFPNAILRPDDASAQITEYRFSKFQYGRPT